MVVFYVMGLGWERVRVWGWESEKALRGEVRGLDMGTLPPGGVG